MGVTIISVLALLGTLVGVYYARDQLQEAKRVREENAAAIARQHQAESEESEWAEKHERLASQLLKLRSPGLTIEPPGLTATTLYPSIFPDVNLREAMETYIVGLHASGTQFVRRQAPRPDELRLAVVRETIRNAEKCMAEFQKQNPKIDLNYYMGFHL